MQLTKSKKSATTLSSDGTRQTLLTEDWGPLCHLRAIPALEHCILTSLGQKSKCGADRRGYRPLLQDPVAPLWVTGFPVLPVPALSCIRLQPDRPQAAAPVRGPGDGHLGHTSQDPPVLKHFVTTVGQQCKGKVCPRCVWPWHSSFTHIHWLKTKCARARHCG